VNGTGPIVEPVQIAEGDIVDFGVDVNDPNDVSRSTPPKEQNYFSYRVVVL